jgi:hypothetical protein
MDITNRLTEPASPFITILGICRHALRFDTFSFLYCRSEFEFLQQGATSLNPTMQTKFYTERTDASTDKTLDLYSRDAQFQSLARNTGCPD